MAPPGKVRDSEVSVHSISPSGLPSCSHFVLQEVRIFNHPVLGWVTFADPSTRDPLGEPWPQGSDATVATGLGPSPGPALFRSSPGAPPAGQAQRRKCKDLTAGPLPLPDFVRVIMRRT
ncbi:unnamed protein product [Pipistrellus nathusii]|uniref:Uncharacterized protein n=1 Tax=Pipistrellus nathusii TaxID=59473 RepID=A0ABN9ZPR8_PIPNA